MDLGDLTPFHEALRPWWSERERERGRERDRDRDRDRATNSHGDPVSAGGSIHITSHHITSCHIISCHVISYHIYCTYIINYIYR